MSWPSPGAWPASSRTARQRAPAIDVEYRLDGGQILAGADQVGVGARAEHEQDGVDQDGLARAGLPREHVEAGREGTVTSSITARFRILSSLNMVDSAMLRPSAEAAQLYPVPDGRGPSGSLSARPT